MSISVCAPDRYRAVLTAMGSNRLCKLDVRVSKFLIINNNNKNRVCSQPVDKASAFKLINLQLFPPESVNYVNNELLNEKGPKGDK